MSAAEDQPPTKQEIDRWIEQIKNVMRFWSWNNVSFVRLEVYGMSDFDFLAYSHWIILEGAEDMLAPYNSTKPPKEPNPEFSKELEKLKTKLRDLYPRKGSLYRLHLDFESVERVDSYPRGGYDYFK